jgi:hypothetical protein
MAMVTGGVNVSKVVKSQWFSEFETAKDKSPTASLFGFKGSVKLSDSLFLSMAHQQDIVARLWAFVISSERVESHIQNM